MGDSKLLSLLPDKIATTRKVTKLMKMYSRTGARYDMRLPERYSRVSEPGLVIRFRMVFQNAFS